MQTQGDPAVRLAVLGDSIAWGQGATREQDRLAPRLAAGLADRGHVVQTRVFAVPGARSRGLGAQVDLAAPWRPDLVAMVIGANDLTHLEPVEEAVAAQVDAVRRLRAAGAEVVLAPAPDLSAVPHVPAALRDLVRRAGEAYRTRQVPAIVVVGGLVADPDQRGSHAFARDPSLFSGDRFHPSSAGYAVIADVLLPTLVAAAGRRDATG